MTLKSCTSFYSLSMLSSPCFLALSLSARAHPKSHRSSSIPSWEVTFSSSSSALDTFFSSRASLRSLCTRNSSSFSLCRLSTRVPCQHVARGVYPLPSSLRICHRPFFSSQQGPIPFFQGDLQAAHVSKSEHHFLQRKYSEIDGAHHQRQPEFTLT